MTEGEQMSTEQETLGQRIKRLRLAKGLTQREVSEMLNVHSGYFSRLESDSRPIRDHMVAAIAAVLGITAEELTRDVHEVAIPKQADKKPPREPDVSLEEARADARALEPEPDQREAEAYGGMSVLCYDDQHDRCKAVWCTCPHHTGPLNLDQEAVEALQVAERDQALYDMELEYTVRVSIATYLRREALSQDSRLVKAYVSLLADEIIAQRDKRSS